MAWGVGHSGVRGGVPEKYHMKKEEMPGTNISAHYSKIEHTTVKCITQVIALSKKKIINQN